MQVWLMVGPAPAAALIELNIDGGIEIEIEQDLIALEIFAVCEIAMPQVENGAIGVTHIAATA